MFFDPNRGGRRVSCRDSRTSEDWAEEVKHLLDVDYPHAPNIRLLCDNLNNMKLRSRPVERCSQILVGGWLWTHPDIWRAIASSIGVFSLLNPFSPILMHHFSWVTPVG
ncbi:hypothetical protein MC7420_3109 [Coleofasciculus chthonoplastes PCC 7420]|uniref:Tc1-like transposase DDE domain-containing protein n=1 Tax=Coleofasciculus chthonoplastes PCC 7420 TaxID=118168 RepID=B4VK10_9CYAN|nr:hypothetical protein MC7420_5292 [Coleofasciculus chthonoplastes PCC 7420]EDX71237.1 hypothetical protein MC7420_2798 [Coleofasciculus chthonoplastes PCC 7420]EDX71470.1 hypothetical protein MC7420_36 [Coleofasciculus chthonoplastes PCC 7420]EDX75513.1 hypothetical protein MC7420_1431 [Coleofasciculus chthonoplastes PCC 7420]EDX76609.1 hypothetical protein MC7420_4865 [Coleofasciculus chthonoplastes PCC 7420]